MTRRHLILALFILSAACASRAVAPAAPPPPVPPDGYHILITNDDGVRAPGILALARALDELGDVTIVAPADNQSAKGHSLTISDPIFVDRVTLEGGVQAWSATATPASAVKVALGGVLRDRPDLVVSGINRGYNLGAVAYVSGTVGAAREAALQGLPAIAASMATEGHPDYAPAAEMVRRIVQRVKASGLAAGVFLNVNIPAGPVESLKGIRVTRQSLLTGVERFEERKTPGGRRYFWSVWEEPAGGEEGTDVWATEHGYVAVTPLRVGEFAEPAYERLTDWR